MPHRQRIVHLYGRGMAALVYDLAETARSGGFAGQSTFVPIALGVSLVTGFVHRARAPTR
jgi:hypothetical protein